jgi:hypothetical protein
LEQQLSSFAASTTNSYKSDPELLFQTRIPLNHRCEDLYVISDTGMMMNCQEAAHFASIGRNVVEIQSDKPAPNMKTTW